MKANEYIDFIEAWSTMIELQAGKDLSDRALKLAFGLLLEYEISEIKTALRQHCLKSPYIAKPADIVSLISGQVPTNSELFGLATEADTILGSFVRHTIGSHDITKLHPRDATARVASYRQTFESFVDRAQSGKFSDSEIQILGGKGFDLTGELCNGLNGARTIHHEPLRARCEMLIKVQIAGATQDDALPEMSEADAIAGKKQLAELMKSLGKAV